MLRLGRPLTLPGSWPTAGWFRALAVVFSVAGVFHLACTVAPSLAGGDPPWRHGLFVAVNAAVALGLLLRPRWFPWIFAVLCMQQAVSHGSAAATAWRVEHRVDKASVLVLCGLPIVLASLVWDARRRPRRESLPFRG